MKNADLKLNGRTYFVAYTSSLYPDDKTLPPFTARFYGLEAYGNSPLSAARSCDSLVQEQTEPEDLA